MHTTFETPISIRPDDLDMNGHVNNSRYFDYVQYARYDQMQRCYGMAMEEFIREGYSWVVATAHIVYKRAISLGDSIAVQTRVQEVISNGAKVWFAIVNKETKKTCSEGYFDYIMVDIISGRATALTPRIIELFSI